MLVDRESINKTLSRRFDSIVFDKEMSLKICESANKKFGIPFGEVMDFISGRILPDDANELQLFILVYALDEVVKTDYLHKFYVENEIADFCKQKYRTTKIKFPIKIDCLQVAPDQWIGRCDAEFLMKLRNSQLIRYNDNAQRALKRRVKGGVETYTIDVNMRAVGEIVDLYNSNNYIPNTITLNMPDDADVKMTYSAEEKRLVISSISHFDIADGYHRFMALSRIYQHDKSFNYDMELRITQFDDNKVKRFIFQEDQKTKMRKIYSDSYNVLDTANIITERVNSDIMFSLNNSISRNAGKINFGEFAQCVQYFYKTKNISSNDRSKFIIETRKELVQKLNAVVDNCSYILNSNRLSFVDLMIIFTCITEDKDIKEIIREVNIGMENKDKLDSKGFVNKVPRKGLVSEIRKVIEENV